jgi:hypothetical protein
VDTPGSIEEIAEANRFGRQRMPILSAGIRLSVQSVGPISTRERNVKVEAPNGMSIGKVAMGAARGLSGKNHSNARKRLIAIHNPR